MSSWEDMGRQLKARRQELGYSQGRLAQLCEVERGTISKIENGKQRPSLGLVLKMSEVLGYELSFRTGLVRMWDSRRSANQTLRSHVVSATGCVAIHDSLWLQRGNEWEILARDVLEAGRKVVLVLSDPASDDYRQRRCLIDSEFNEKRQYSWESLVDELWKALPDRFELRAAPELFTGPFVLTTASASLPPSLESSASPSASSDNRLFLGFFLPRQQSDFNPFPELEPRGNIGRVLYEQARAYVDWCKPQQFPVSYHR